MECRSDISFGHLFVLVLASSIVLVSSPVFALECSSADIELDSQAQVDSFQSDYGGGETCDTVTGDLTIEGPDITHLSALSGLTGIGGFLIIQDTTQLADLDGLSALTTIGRTLRIERNQALTNLDGLAGVTEVRSLDLDENGLLATLDGLSGITELNALIISDNDTLVNLDGLSGIERILSDLSLDRNAALVDINGLSGVESVGNNLSIRESHMLTGLDGLSSVKTVGRQLIISLNHSLENVDGLSSLTSVGHSLYIRSNSSLRDLDGLSNVISVGHSLHVRTNFGLADCYGLARLVDQVDDGEPGPGPGPGGIPDVWFDVYLERNLYGCNSVSEILHSGPLDTINAGLNDAWFNPETDGQGFFIIVYPEIGQMFLTWFTYDVERPDEDLDARLGEPGHRWLTAQGSFVDNQAVLEVWIARGGIFDSPVPEVELEPDGEIIVEFSTCNSGTITYDIPSVERQGVVPIERLARDNIALCAALNEAAE